MTSADPATLSTLLAAAIVTGVLHTAAGPDHYVPIVAAAQARGWTIRRSLAFTAAAGLLHCAAAALLVVIATVATLPWSAVAAVEAWRGTLLGGALLGTGLLLCLQAWRRGRAPRRLSPLLLALFALGPCEWLLPSGLAAAALGPGCALSAIAVFAAATVATMLGFVAVGLRCLPRVRPAGRFVRLLPGAAMAACGTFVLLGG